MTDPADLSGIDQETLLRALAAQRGEDLADIERRLAPVASITIDDARHQYEAAAGGNTRRTYATHLRRFAERVAPLCDQFCEPCLAVEGLDDFVCRCDCANCRKSRIELPPQGPLPVSAHTMSVANARTVAVAARRNAKKRAVVRDRKRASKGRALRHADGRGAQETAVAALRSFFAANGHPLDLDGPGALKKPKRSTGQRRALRDFELLELCNVTETSGNDPELDALVVEYGLATGSRRLGTYKFTVGQLRPAEQMITMIDKNDQRHDAPVSADLIGRLLDHAIARGGERCNPDSALYDPDSPVFWMPARSRGVDWTPLTSRRFENLHTRWQTAMDWAEVEQVGFHHLRHTVAERLKAGWGQHVAQRYLRHSDGDVTDMYGRCDTTELARALGELLEFDHPLVSGVAQRRLAALDRYGIQTADRTDPT